LDIRFLADFILHPPALVWQGLLVTVAISVVAQAAGVALGLAIALARRSSLSSLRSLAGAYVWVWRGTPLLVQLLLVYTGVAAAGFYRYPDIVLGPLVISGPIQAALLTLSCNEAAYMSEIFRSAIRSVGLGQDDFGALHERA
jgi:polar amino acid transport system permease protein